MSDNLLAGDQTERTIQFYSDKLHRFGVDPRSLDWGSRATQQLRFAILCQAGDLRGASVLDVGCGLADLYDYLLCHEKSFSYTGFDVTPAMIAASQSRFPETQFEVHDIVDHVDRLMVKADYVLSSGLFTFGDDMFFERAVSRMFSACRVALAFNVLSTFAPQQELGEYCADPGLVLRFCRTLTPWTVLRHDYLPNDFTIYMYRERRQQ